jgi:hypothetical protein
MKTLDCVSNFKSPPPPHPYYLQDQQTWIQAFQNFGINKL